MLLEQLDIHRQKKEMNLDTNLTPCTKINSKWITNLNVKQHKTIKPLKDNIGENVDELCCGDNFLFF